MYQAYSGLCSKVLKIMHSCTFYHCVCMQALSDLHLALGVLTLVSMDVIILLVYAIVEGVQGNLTAVLVPNRENPRDIEGVS